MVLLLADSLCAIALAAASIAAAYVGDDNYVLLRQSVTAMFTMAFYLVIMLVDAAHAFDDEGESETTKSTQMSTYKPSQNKTSYKPSGNNDVNSDVNNTKRSPESTQRGYETATQEYSW